jgi:hypothetical protein
VTRPTGKGTVAIVTACMRSDGLPDFALTEVQVSPEEYQNGAHYDRAEARLVERGYEEPFVHFEELEAPAFLLPAVKRYLARAARATDPVPTPRRASHAARD